MTDPIGDPRPLTAGVMGWPIVHSRSPRIFAHWFAAAGIEGRYCHLAVCEADFEQVFRTLPRAGFRGVNVTVPHKLSALRCADSATDTARQIGAANMIRFTPDGEIIADNTDAYGFIENIRQGAPDWNPASGPAVVLGAGGAARAVLVALRDAGAPQIRLINRTSVKADDLAAELGDPISVIPWQERSSALADAATLVNTSSLGMTGQPKLEIALDDLPETALINDIVYTPLRTDLLAAGRARGNPTVDGLGMLLHQARPSYRAWFGGDPLVDETLRQVCLA
ncbi:MAG: shikimate dehydrogenase [Pseudomonadota bacterium]